MASSIDEEFSVLVLASDLGVDGTPFLNPNTSNNEEDEEDDDDDFNWEDCPSYFADHDFSDLDTRDFFRLQGSDKSGFPIFRIVGKFFPVIRLWPQLSLRDRNRLFVILTQEPASYIWSLVRHYGTAAAAVVVVGNKGPILGILMNFIATIISAERLKKYVFYKIYTELPEGPFSILYIHTTAQKDENSPGMTILRWIYEDLPSDIKDRLQVMYFLHPGLRSRLAFATLGRFFLSGNLYWKIKYVSRLQYLWDDIKKGEVEIPDFVKSHDDILENRPLTDYGIEPDPLRLTEIPSSTQSFSRYEERWASRMY